MSREPGEDHWINANDGLGAVDGFDSLLTVGEHFRVGSGLGLVLNGIQFPSLSDVGGEFRLTNVDQVGAVDFSSLVSVGGDFEPDALAITSLDTFSNLRTVGGRVSVGPSTTLTSVDGLGGIASVGGDLERRPV